MMTFRHDVRVASFVSLLLSLALAPASWSQAMRQAARALPTSRAEVRSELAATLLNANRFSEAAAEYRRLLAGDPQNRDYRLGLARALAWGDHPREAERELLLARDRQNAAVVEPLLRSVRASFDPTARQAAVWLRESPGYLPYRLAFARALAREEPHRAIAQFDTLRLAALAGAADVPREPTLIREEADAYLAMGARTQAIALLGVAVSETPGDTALRHSLAAALFDARMVDASRAEYDTLVAMAPSDAAYVGRGMAALAMGDTTGAQDDLGRSINIRPSYDAYYLLASVAREHEDFFNAGLLYDAARRTAPDAARRHEVATAKAGLAREQRPLVAFAPSLASDAGWSMTTQSATDNAHVSYVAIDASRVAPLADGFVSELRLGARRIAQSGALGLPAATGTAASVGVARQLVAGRAIVGAAADAGLVAHPGIATFGRGSLTLGGWLDAWGLSLDLSREPAYESLFTPAVLSPRDGETQALLANAATLGGGGPLGPVDVAGGWTRTWLSDGNRSESIDAYARIPLADISPHLSAVYEANVVSYAHPATLYWDPVRYTSHAIGPELATRHARGLSLSARVLAGLASEVDRDTATSAAGVAPGGRRARPPSPRDQNLIRRSAVQLSTSGEASYRTAWWEGAADVAYGRARAGGYQRLSATITIRVLR